MNLHKFCILIFYSFVDKLLIAVVKETNSWQVFNYKGMIEIEERSHLENRQLEGEENLSGACLSASGNSIGETILIF